MLWPAKPIAGQSSGQRDSDELKQEPKQTRRLLESALRLEKEGQTAAAIMDYLRERKPASLALCTLLDKPARRLAPISAQYVGFTIPDHFVIGYGLDYNQRGRELPDIRILSIL